MCRRLVGLFDPQYGFIPQSLFTGMSAHSSLTSDKPSIGKDFAILSTTGYWEAVACSGQLPHDFMLNGIQCYWRLGMDGMQNKHVFLESLFTGLKMVLIR